MTSRSNQTNKPLDKKNKSESSSIWGGRFEGKPHEIMDQINPSIDFDKRFFRQDIKGSKAHAEMLSAQKIITESDKDKIIHGLDQIEKEIDEGTFKFSRELEDIHMNIEARLAALVGDAAGRLHTGRSRNDQVATDFKLWIRDTIDILDKQLMQLQAALIDLADQNFNQVMPGFTHLQVAQPVTFGHHLLAYVEMLGRDRTRFQDGRARLNECPLGSAALAGTSFPIDRNMTSKALGFDRPTANSLDSVSDRDFALEFLSSASICSIHLSRFAEEVVNWTSSQFNFISLSDAFTTGSSIMPQKRNPDAAELVRGKTGRIIGALNALMVMMKGLPLAFCKDMQEDKEPLFDATETLHVCIAACTGMVQDIEANSSSMENASELGFSTATDLADWLVRVLNIPFRQAHHITGCVVKLAEQKKCLLKELTLDDLKNIEPKITNDIYAVLEPSKSISSRRSYGGTAPQNVKTAISVARQRFLES
jgi:argininosuccinate lyase